RDGAGADHGEPGDPPPAGQDRLGGVEDHAEPAPTGVDDTGLAELTELLGGVDESLAGGVGSRGEDVTGPDAGVLGTSYGGVGGGAGDGQDGALDRRTDRRVAGVRG